MAHDNEKLLTDPNDAWNAHDPDKVISFFTDDCVFEDTTMNIVCHGKKELAAFAKSLYYDYPDLHFKTESHSKAGENVVWEWTMTATHTHSSITSIKATGKPFLVRGVSILELREGKIKRETDYYNGLTIMIQLGLIPGMPSS